MPSRGGHEPPGRSAHRRRGEPAGRAAGAGRQLLRALRRRHAPRAVEPRHRGPRRGRSAANRPRHVRVDRGGAMSAPAPSLAPDLAAGLRRLKVAAVRRLAPEVLVTAKTQRWAPEELLRTLIDAEIAARDASNARARLRAANFPVRKSLEDFDLSASSVPTATFDYLASLEWIR